jgi:hypothetical protein
MCGRGGAGKARSDKLDDEIAEDWKKNKNEVKLLLLGNLQSINKYI